MDLAAADFPLIGGRIDRLDGRAVAALVYQRHRHVITVYVSADDRPNFGSAKSRRGFHVQTWKMGGFEFAAVSDLAKDELGEFVPHFTAAAK